MVVYFMLLFELAVNYNSRPHFPTSAIKFISSTSGIKHLSAKNDTQHRSIICANFRLKPRLRKVQLVADDHFLRIGLVETLNIMNKRDKILKQGLDMQKLFVL